MKKYIYADKLIKDLNDLSEHYTDKGKEYHPHIDFVMDTVNQQPAANVRENVKGKWIDITMWHDEYFGNKCQAPAQKCSNCGEWSVGINNKFCSNCGADMRNEAND